MRTFIDDVILDLIDNHYDISHLTFILPSKRAGTFLQHAISKHVKKTIFSPKIVSIEFFIESLSDSQYASNTEILFEFYDIYLKHTPDEFIEPFDQFSKWAQILIQDFNEIDRYLIPPNDIFDYLSAIKDIENLHWSVDDNPTTYIKNYLQFWKRLKTYYHELQKQLSKKKKAYQGLVYREAQNNIEQFMASHSNEKFVFIGFNALNNAEELIIRALLQQDLALIYWDIDESFLNRTYHDAGLFIREHLSKWNYFKTKDFKWPINQYLEKKEIQVIGAPKNISQIKYVGELLHSTRSKQENLQNTAVILSDETLLLPLLNSLPKSIGPVNITMGLPLKVVPIAALFEALFNLHKSNSKQLYYKHIVEILSNPFVNTVLKQNNLEDAELVINHIKEQNKTYVTLTELFEIAPDQAILFDLLFNSWNDRPSIAIKNCLRLIAILKTHLDKDKVNNLLSLEYLYRFHQIFNTLETLNSSFDHINSISTLSSLYLELIKNETLDFKGEPLSGLQIMGMLESRVLDFETVIIVSVNEGILPAGKQHNSFIPFDVKLENQLPTYKEKDAVYTYHFYRLLQRAKSVYILYNTEPDVLNGGEKSRLITQLEVENIHDLKSFVVSAEVPVLQNRLKCVKKTDNVLKALDSLAIKGFSPSSLTNYMRNPIDFYYDKVLGIKPYDDIEESVAYNTLGTVIHNTLEDFYKPLEGQTLNEALLKKMQSKIGSTVTHHFNLEFKEGDITKGINLIIFEIAQRYISNFIKLELKAVKNGDIIEIVAIETENIVSMYVDALGKNITLKGKVDRVDRHNGVLRIIDYKSGKVETGKVEIVEWEDITTDYDKYSKSFQVLMYAYMMYKNNNIKLPIEAGIISFKNLGAGLLKFAVKPSDRSKTKDHMITAHTLSAFETELKNLIVEIYNPEIDFIENEL